MEKIYEEKYNGLTIRIGHEEDIQSPDTWQDDRMFLVGFDNQFSVSREGFSKAMIESIMNKGRYEDDSINDDARAIMKKYHFFPLAAYIHSGVSLSLSREKYPFNDRWDSGYVGMVFVLKKEFRTRTRAEKAAQGLVSEWNDALSGNVYYYVIEDEEQEVIESCGGFYGDYREAGGALPEARETAAAYAARVKSFEVELNAPFTFKVKAKTKTQARAKARSEAKRSRVLDGIKGARRLNDGDIKEIS